MESISNQLPDLSLFNPFASNEGTLNKTQSSSASLQVEQSSDITLFTAEGDKVTLSSFSSLEASYATYSSQGLIDGVATQSHIEAFSITEQFAMELSIEGDLNEQELKDILKAFKTIEKLSEDFFSGNTEDALDYTEKITGLDSIAGFDANLQYSLSLSVQQTVTKTAPALPESAAQTSPLQVPSTPVEDNPLPTAPPNITEAETPPVPGPIETDPIDDLIKTSEAEPDTPALAQPGLSEGAQSFVEKIIEAILDTQVSLEKIVNPFSEFLEELFDKLEQGIQINPFLFQEADAIRSEASLEIEAVPEAEEVSHEEEISEHNDETDHEE